MFTIDNHLYEGSFQYNQPAGSSCLGEREGELLKLNEIYNYCRVNNEMLLCDQDKFYDTEVEPGISLCDWVFLNQGTGNHDARSMLLYMLDSIREYTADGDGEIPISLGTYKNCVCTEDDYKEKRREFLTELTDVDEFAAFMKTCFHNTVFSDTIIHTMRKIPKFRECTKQITYNLALLNDHAVEIYTRHNFNAAEAMKELSIRGLECTGDPSHKSYLKFPFSYVKEEEDSEPENVIKEIQCSPHMKLIRPDSNLRIYFFWFDDQVGEGEKVLIGHIGAHPY